ncbi:Creatinase aminopeptidase [Cristinia sonorae]|uniref:Creatinase aminopeptidase n=1 Tax=Cristinia sonorae TaxID=1940300 RepID=A0A8K0UXI4_9AGAR|nr:Creatinase aminopeptidase [Cristinia sonorae]
MAPPPPPPPPPPPICLPFSSKKKPKRLTYSERAYTESYNSERSSINRLERSGSYSPTATLTSKAEKLTFSSDSEAWPDHTVNEAREVPVLRRSATTREKSAPKTPEKDNEKSAGGGSKRWGYGWGAGKKEKEKEREREMAQDLSRQNTQSTRPPLYQSPARSNSQRTQTSESINYINPLPPHMANAARSGEPSRSNTFRSQNSGNSNNTASTSRTRRPHLYPSDSSSTLVGSALERKVNDVDTFAGRPDTGERLEALRELMKKDSLDYYIIPTEDAHGSEYVGINDKRREWISAFTGTAGVAVVSKSSAYLVTDSRYWAQARQELDANWNLVQAGDHDGPKDWVDFLVDRVQDSRVGMDARMISHEKATALNNQLQTKHAKLVYPPQNLVDLIWRDKPSRSKAPIFRQSTKYAGVSAEKKLQKLKRWIAEQSPSVPSYSKSEPKPAQKQVATLISNLSSIAYLLNLRGDDVPFNPVFHAYLFVSADQSILFIEPAKVNEEIDHYLESLNITRRDYNDLWTFLRRKEWGEGKIIIAPTTSYAISLMLTSFRYTVLPSFVEEMKAIKNEAELEGLRNAYLKDGAAWVRWQAWLEAKMSQGYDITEYEAAWRLTEFRREQEGYRGLAYSNISGSGPNAALPHYTPRKNSCRMIDRETPYLNDSGGQYVDGTCDTTRTIHFGRPTNEQCEAFTRVLQGHIAIDSAVFPEGTSGKSLDVLARKALWKDGLNYMHGTGHGFGAYLNVHEGPHGFSSETPLVHGHVITNEPGFYLEGKWGVRLESALAVKRVQTKGNFNGDIWLGFERLTCVPIQTKMVKDSMLSKEEKQWLKDHNKTCFERLEPLIRQDKRALKWLKREADRGIGLAPALAGGMSIDWD